MIGRLLFCSLLLIAVLTLMVFPQVSYGDCLRGECPAVEAAHYLQGVPAAAEARVLPHVFPILHARPHEYRFPVVRRVLARRPLLRTARAAGYLVGRVLSFPLRH